MRLSQYSGAFSECGKSTRVDGRYFNGALDDLRVYHRVLSSTEVQALYTAHP